MITSSGAFSLTTSKYCTTFRGVVLLDVDHQEHPRGVLGDVVAERVGVEQLLEQRGGVGRPAGVEEGLAAGVELVRSGLVGVGRRLARGEHLEVAGGAEVAAPGVIGAADRRRQRPVLAGQVAVDVVADRARPLVGGEVEREHAVGLGERAGRGLHRAVDERRARGEVLLDDEEVALPLRLIRRLDAVGVDVHARPPAHGHLAHVVLEVGGVDRDTEARGQGLAVELGVGREVHPAVDQGDPVGLVLVGAEVAGEPAQGDREPEGAPPLEVEPHAVPVAGLQRVARHEHRLAFRGADHLGLVDLGVVDGDDEVVAVLGRLGPPVVAAQRGQRGPFGLVGLPAEAGAVGEQPGDGLLELGGLGPGLGVRQSDQRSGLGRAAVPGRDARAAPRAAGLAAGLDGVGLAARAEDVEHLAGQRLAVEVGEGQREVGQRRVGEPLAEPVEAVGHLEIGLAAGREGVKDRGPGLVVAGAELAVLLGQERGGLVQSLRVGQQSERLGRRQRPHDAAPT